MLVAKSLSEHEYLRAKHFNPKSINRFIYSTQFVVMLPPLAASVLYYPADIHFLERIGILDKNFQGFVAVCCIIAELCLYEVKTAKFGEMLGTELHKISYLLEPKFFLQYVKDNFSLLTKHFLIAMVSLESSYVYGYLSQELLGILALSIATVIAKFTTFHFALTDLINYFVSLYQDPEMRALKKVGIVTGTLLLGVSGSTYVYGKSEVAFEQLTGMPTLSIVGAAISVLPTAFLTGSSLINFFKEFKNCGQPTWRGFFKEFLFCWFAATAAAPNAHFLEDWGRDKIDAVWLWTLVIIVGITSLITKRDALIKATESVIDVSQQCYRVQWARFFAKDEERDSILTRPAALGIVPHTY